MDKELHVTVDRLKARVALLEEKLELLLEMFERLAKTGPG